VAGQAPENYLLRSQPNAGSPNVTVDARAALYAVWSELPITGDWSGAGYDQFGRYDTTTSQFVLCIGLSKTVCNTSVVSHTMTFGNPGDRPLAGVWQGGYTAGIGVYRPTNGLVYLKNAIGSGQLGNADYSWSIGLPGDQAVTGDWNGDGIDTAGVYSSNTHVFSLSNSNSPTTDYQFTFSGLNSALTYIPIAGNWTANPGGDGVGVYETSTSTFYLKNGTLPTTGTVTASSSFTYGLPGDTPLAGLWPTSFIPTSLSLPSVLVPSTALPVGPAVPTISSSHD